MENRQVPALRFQGFTDAWEQRKFSDLYTPLIERNADLLPFNKTLSVATMTYKADGNGAADSSQANYKRLRIGDIAFEGHTSKEFRYGRFVLNDAGDGIMSPRFSALRPLTQLPINFWKYYIHYEPIMRKVLVNSTKAGTMMNELVVDEFLKGSILVPTEEEQIRIGEVFANLDHLITLHQRKYEKLQKVKKSMLEKMFPRNGAKVPEIRFDGFTGAWEQRKLGDIYIERNERGNANLDILSVSIHHGVSNNELNTDALGKNVRRSEDKSLYKHVYYGDLVFNMMRAWQGAIGVVKNEGMVSPAYVSATPDDSVFPEFMDYCLRRKSIINQINNLSYGVTDFRKRLYWEPFTRVTVMMPSVDEQRKITGVLRRLDALITLHQRELEKLKNIKKSMLEKMFV